MQRAAIFSGGDFFFGGARLLHGPIGRERGIGVEPSADSAAAFEIGLGEFDRRQLLLANAFGKFGDRQIENVGVQHGYVPSRSRRVRKTVAGWSLLVRAKARIFSRPS